MIPEQEIRSKLRALVALELDSRLSKASKRLPGNCLHNHQQPLDTRRSVEGEVNESYNRIASTNASIGLCMLGSHDTEDWKGTICEDPIDAQRCSFFQPRFNRAAVVQEYGRQLLDLSWVEEHKPAIATLLWVLGLVKVPSLSLWKRLLLRFGKLKVEPVKTVDSNSLLLTSGASDNVASDS